MAPEDVDPHLPIGDEEVVYRRVLPSPYNHFFLSNTGELRLSSQAFADRNMRPSVDRERICASLGGASFTQKIPANGVLKLVVRSIRGIDNLEASDKKGRRIQSFRADVHPAPVMKIPGESDNPAHCEIRLAPDETRRVYDRLIERLSRLAEWAIKPACRPSADSALAFTRNEAGKMDTSSTADVAQPVSDTEGEESAKTTQGTVL